MKYSLLNVPTPTHEKNHDTLKNKIDFWWLFIKVCSCNYIPVISELKLRADVRGCFWINRNITKTQISAISQDTFSNLTYLRKLWVCVCVAFVFFFDIM